MTEDMPQGKKTVSDKQIEDFIASADAPFVFAAEVADHFGHTRQWAHSRLQSLHEEETVEKKAANNSAAIWYLNGR